MSKLEMTYLARTLIASLTVLSIGLGIALSEVSKERDQALINHEGMVSQFDYDVMKGKFGTCRERFFNAGRGRNK